MIIFVQLLQRYVDRKNQAAARAVAAEVPVVAEGAPEDGLTAAEAEDFEF